MIWQSCAYVCMYIHVDCVGHPLCVDCVNDNSFNFLEAWIEKEGGGGERKLKLSHSFCAQYYA